MVMTTANKLTILRMILVPVFMVLMMIEGAWWQTSALIVFIIASITDAVDGHIARNYNQITTFGKFMDPIADKMLTTAAFVVFVAIGRMSPWALMIILVREFMVSGIRLLAAADGSEEAMAYLQTEAPYVLENLGDSELLGKIRRIEGISSGNGNKE